MTVQELINKLTNLPLQADVYVSDTEIDYDNFADIINIKLDEVNNVIIKVK